MKLKEFLNKYNKFLLLLLSFLVLRFYLLLTLPEVSDESIYIYKTYLMTEGWQIYRDFGDNRMPGFFLLFYPFMYIYKIIASPPYENIIFFGRIFALISSFISVIFIFKIGSYIRNERTGFIASALFVISPYALGLYNYVFLENFLTAFSLCGFYFFIRGMEENSERNLFVSGISFGFAVLMKQMAVLLFPVAIFILLLKNTKSLSLRDIGKFLRQSSIVASGGFLAALVILLYFIYHGTLFDFYHAVTTSVQQAQEWVSPSREKIFQDYIMPPLMANELITLIFGFLGIIFSLILFIKQRDMHFGIKTLTFWFLCYTAVMYLFSYSYGLYYIPMLPPLVMISSYTIDFFLSSLNSDYKKVLIVLISIIFIADLIYLGVQYQDFTQNPMKKTTMLTPTLNQQISIGKYLYEHTNSSDKIFSMDPIYTLVSGREVVNHFTVSGTELPTNEEYISALGNESVKYAIIDDRARFHLNDKWGGEKISSLNLSMNFKLTSQEGNSRDGIVIELGHKGNSSLWWIHAKNWKIPDNGRNIVNYDMPIIAGEWTTIETDLITGFREYFGYSPDDMKFTLWANANDGSNIKFEMDSIRLWDGKDVYLDESFNEPSSLRTFTIETSEGKNKKKEGWSKIDIIEGHITIETINENYGLSMIVSPGVLGYIMQNFEKEKDFVIIARKTEPRETVVSLYRKR